MKSNLEIKKATIDDVQILALLGLLYFQTLFVVNFRKYMFLEILHQ